MIKLFRNIRKNLLNEGKTTKYFKYAIGEIVLVVIGILIALSINTWNENRLDRIKEKTIMASINKEFKANQVQLDSVLYYHNKALENSKKLVAMFPIDIKEDNLDSISTYLTHSVAAWTFNPSQGSINSIINSSSLELIRNEELREYLVSWQGLVIDFQEDEMASKNILNNQIDPFLGQHMDWNFNFKDERNNLKILESLKFEYIIHQRVGTLNDILNESSQLEPLSRSLSRMIVLTEPKP